MKRSPTLAVALATLILAAPLALHAQTQCTLQDAKVSLTFPIPLGTPLEEDQTGNSQAIIGVNFPPTCQALAKPLTVCLDVWDTTACPPEALPGECDQRRGIRGSAGVVPVNNWVKASGPTVCNQRFLAEYEINGMTQTITSAPMLVSTFDDNTKARWQNHLLVVMYDPFQFLRIPIIDND